MSSSPPPTPTGSNNNNKTFSRLHARKPSNEIFPPTNYLSSFFNSAFTNNNNNHTPKMHPTTSNQSKSSPFTTRQILAILLFLVAFLQLFSFLYFDDQFSKHKASMAFHSSFVKEQQRQANLHFHRSDLNELKQRPNVGIVSFFSKKSNNKKKKTNVASSSSANAIFSSSLPASQLPPAERAKRMGMNLLYRGHLFDERPYDGTTVFTHRLSWKNRVEYCEFLRNEEEQDVSSKTFRNKNGRLLEKTSAKDSSSSIYKSKRNCDFILENKEGVTSEHKKTNLKGDKNKNVHPAFGKILAIRKWLPHYEWIMWLDADALIMNFNISVRDDLIGEVLAEQKIENPGKEVNLIIGQDFNGINSGVFMIRNTPWSFDFLTRVYNFDDEVEGDIDPSTGKNRRLCPYSTLFNDQRPISCIIQYNLDKEQHEKDLSHIVLLPPERQRFFNSYGQKKLFDNTCADIGTSRPMGNVMLSVTSGLKDAVSKLRLGLMMSNHKNKNNDVVSSLIENDPILNETFQRKKQFEELNSFKTKYNDYYAPSSPSLPVYAFQRGDFLAHFPNCKAFPLCRYNFLQYFENYHIENGLPILPNSQQDDDSSSSSVEVNGNIAKKIEEINKQEDEKRKKDEMEKEADQYYSTWFESLFGNPMDDAAIMKKSKDVQTKKMLLKILAKPLPRVIYPKWWKE